MQTILFVLLYVATMLSMALHATQKVALKVRFTIQPYATNDERTDWHAELAFKSKECRTEFAAYLELHAKAGRRLIHGKAEKKNKYCFFSLLENMKYDGRININLYTNGTFQWRGISGEEMIAVIDKFNNS